MKKFAKMRKLATSTLKGLATLIAVAGLAFGVVGTAKAQTAFPFDGNLVGYWSFNVDQADPTNDDSVNMNDGALVGPPVYDCTDVASGSGSTNTCSLDFAAGDSVGVADTVDLGSVDIYRSAIMVAAIFQVAS
jgi:hypothetical protein